MAPVELGSDNVHTLKFLDVPLCVECLACRHRALLQPADLQHGRADTEMTSLAVLTRRLRCSYCGSGAVKALRATSIADGQAFVAEWVL